MSHGQAMRNVIVPQAVRKVIPPLLNDFIALMKDTSLVSVIGARRGRPGRHATSSRRPSTAPALTLGALMFLIVTIPLARLVDWLIAPAAGAATSGGSHEPGRRPVADDRRARDRSTARSSSCSEIHKSFGELDVLRRRRPERRPRRGRLRARAERLRQEHAAALHQPARAARRGPDLPRGQGDHRQAARRGTRLRPPPGRHGLPAVQPVPAQDARSRT